MADATIPFPEDPDFVQKLKDVSGGTGAAHARAVVLVDANSNPINPTGSGGPATIVDGGDVTQGHMADARSTATDTTPITVMQVLKELSYQAQNPAAVTANAGASGSPVALSSPPAALVANTAATLTFASAVNHFLVANNSAAALCLEWDGSTATPGSYPVLAGAAIILDIHTSALSVLSTLTPNINGATASNIYVKGWS